MRAYFTHVVLFACLADSYSLINPQGFALVRHIGNRYYSKTLTHSLVLEPTRQLALYHYQYHWFQQSQDAG